ncbi:hypothetical protein [Kitasatospora sp. NPDC057198]|uniref:hypothetical protein n=1 Tax=Kitasatospora sp. NPDC057198 TaxID=3346046 RepID=UPI00362ED523
MAAPVDEFRKVIRHVASAGGHVLEWLEGTESITLNGHPLWAEDIVALIDKLTEALALLGGKPPERPE